MYVRGVMIFQRTKVSYSLQSSLLHGFSFDIRARRGGRCIKWKIFGSVLFCSEKKRKKKMNPAIKTGTVD